MGNAQTASKCTISARCAEREAAILSGARKVFLESGFVGATMDAIAEEANVSKQTVYNHYRSKEELFAAMIRTSCREILEVLQTDSPKGDPRSFLRLVGAHFLRLALDPNKLALRRVLLPEISRFPELGQIYYRSGPAYLHEFLSDYFAEQNERGTLRVSDPHLLADQFIGMLAACSYKAELGIETVMDEAERCRYIDHAVDLVMRAAHPESPSPIRTETRHG